MSNDKSAEEIVRGLEATAEIMHRSGDDAISTWLRGWLETAAALLKSQAAEIAAGKEANDSCHEYIKTLKAQLSASQQETRAAVEDMKHVADRIQSCNEKLSNDKDAVSSLNLGRCDVCKKHCHDDSGCRFEWRGDVGRKD